MYRILPNPSLHIDDDYTIWKDGKVFKKGNRENNVTIELYGNSVTKTLEWFYLLAKNKIQLPWELEKEISKITFRKYGKVFSKRLTYCIQTKHPLIVGDGYAIPLSLPTIAISKDCRVLDLHDRTVMKNIQSKYRTEFTNGYTKKYIHGNHVLVHRLMLEAWEYNPDTNIYVLGNHKDGDKLNNKLDNLEWSTHRDNMIHAVETGLRSDNTIVRIRNIKTLEVLKFHSIRSMCDHIGRKGILKDRLLNMRLGEHIENWEIRVDGDSRDWYFKTGKEKPIPTFASFMYEINGEKFFNISTLNSYLDNPIRTPVEKIKELYPDIKITPLKRNTPYDVYEEESKKLHSNLSINDVKDITGYSLSKIQKIVKKKPYFNNGYAVREASDDYWNYETIETSNPKSYYIENKNIETGEIITYPSARQASKCLGISPKTIMKYIKNKKPYFKFELSIVNNGHS